MVFSVIYQTQTSINKGSSYTSSHIIQNVEEEEKLFYSYEIPNNIDNNEITFDEYGDFTIKSQTVGTLQFTITVKNNNGIGYNIPIFIEIVDKIHNFLQYSYQTGYSFSASFHIFPSTTPELKDLDYPQEVDRNYFFMLVGAPSGIVIDSNTGQIFGSPINYGQFISTVHVIDTLSNTYICSSTLQFMIYNSNILTEIIDISPTNEIIHSKYLPITVTCNYTGAPPSQAQSLAYKLSCPSFQSSTIINYESLETVKLTYLVHLSNIPGRFPITLTDNISGFFITSSLDICFTSTAACFNEDTTVLSFNKEEKEEYKSIKELCVGDYIKTYKHGKRKITHIGNQSMWNNPDSVSDCMYKLSVRISKEKISHDLILLGRHSILVDNLTKRQKTKTLEIHPVDKIDDKELLITMFNEDFDAVEEQKEFTYYHLVLEPDSNDADQRFGIYVNGSLHPDDPRPGLMAATTTKKDFLKQFNKNN